MPAFVVASWADQGLHTRGTLDRFRPISSAQKWLDVHGQKKWACYYEPEQVERQRAFFDHFVLGRDTGIEDWPRVRVEVRNALNDRVHRTATQRPLEDVEYRRLHLRAGDASLSWTPAEAEDVVFPGSDVMRCPKPLTYARHEDTVNRGTHRVHTGGRYDSSLLVPVLPAEAGAAPA